MNFYRNYILTYSRKPIKTKKKRKRVPKYPKNYDANATPDPGTS